MSKANLLPCPNPLCTKSLPFANGFQISCYGCGTSGAIRVDHEKAIAAWNSLPRLTGTVYDGTEATLPPMLTDVLVEMPGGTRFCCKHHAEGDVVFANDESFKLPKGCRWWLWPGGGE